MNTRSTLRAFGVLVAVVLVVGLMSCKPEQQSSGSISPIPTSSSTALPGFQSPPPTPEPQPTPIVPSIIEDQLQQSAAGNPFKPIYVSKDYKAMGELCDLHVSPDSNRVALTICSTEGVLFNVYITDMVKGTSIFANISDASDTRLPAYAKPTWFRGWLPDSKRVLLMSDWLQVLNIETGTAERVTPKNETITDAAISPDGQRIAYALIQGNGLKIIDVTGSLLREIPAPSPQPGVRPEGITWSADGRFIAYIWDQIVGQFNSYGPLWVVDTQTWKQWQLSPEMVYDGFPTWSPQKDQILVVRRENMKDESAHFDLNKLVSNLWVVDVNTQTWRQLTNWKDRGAWSPTWTPDASTVIFMSNAGGEANVWMMNVDGSGEHQLRTGRDLMPRAIGLAQETAQ